jgi:PqqD family protein of HPr-rel-A system
LPEPTWHAVESDALRWHDADDGSLVFHRLTGETHYFNLYATFIFRSVQEFPRTEADLQCHIAEQLGEDVDDAFTQKIRVQLGNFEEMAILEARET